LSEAEVKAHEETCKMKPRAIGDGWGDGWKQNCLKLIERFWTDAEYEKAAKHFYKAVDTKTHHDYNTVISTPMDLERVKVKHKNEEYSFPDEFLDDVRLIFTNCYEYNGADHEIMPDCHKLSDMFERDIAGHVCVCGKRFDKKSSLSGHKSTCVLWQTNSEDKSESESESESESDTGRESDDDGAEQPAAERYVCVCGKGHETRSSLTGHKARCEEHIRQLRAKDGANPARGDVSTFQSLLFKHPSCLTHRSCSSCLDN
jgi:hypothetical protein